MSDAFQGKIDVEKAVYTTLQPSETASPARDVRPTHEWIRAQRVDQSIIPSVRPSGGVDVRLTHPHRLTQLEQGKQEQPNGRLETDIL